MTKASLRLAERLFKNVKRIPEGIDVRPIADSVLTECGIAATYREKLEFTGDLAEAIAIIRELKRGTTLTNF